MNYSVYQQRTPKVDNAAAEEYSANLHYVGEFTYENDQVAFKELKRKLPFVTGKGLGKHPVFVNHDVKYEESM